MITWSCIEFSVCNFFPSGAREVSHFWLLVLWMRSLVLVTFYFLWKWLFLVACKIFSLYLHSRILTVFIQACAPHLAPPVLLWIWWAPSVCLFSAQGKISSLPGTLTICTFDFLDPLLHLTVAISVFLVWIIRYFFHSLLQNINAVLSMTILTPLFLSLFTRFLYLEPWDSFFKL